MTHWSLSLVQDFAFSPNADSALFYFQIGNKQKERGSKGRTQEPPPPPPAKGVEVLLSPYGLRGEKPPSHLPPSAPTWLFPHLVFSHQLVFWPNLILCSQLVFSSSTYLPQLFFLNFSFLPQLVFSSSTRLFFLNSSFLPQLVFSSSTCLFFLNLSFLPQLVFSSSTCTHPEILTQPT